MFRTALLTALSILSTATFLFSTQTKAENLDSEMLYPIVLELFATHKVCLKHHGFGYVPGIMFDDRQTSGRQAYVNTLRSTESDGLKDLYDLYFSAGFLKNTSIIEFLTVAAHELGHLAGDGPRDDTQNSTVEGEADYQSGRLLLPFVLAKPELLATSIDPLLENKIAAEFGLTKADTTDLAKIKILAGAYKSLSKGERTKIMLKKPYVGEIAHKTSADYPSAQERWNTVVAGLFNLPRPKSWAFAPDFRDSCSGSLTGI